MSKIIQEAFREFNLLNEAEEFTLDVSGVDELSSFLDMAGGDDDIDVEVIDLEAEAKEDLKNSYMGKVIVDCNVCHSNIFMNKEDIVVDEDGNVNIETECPYCMSNEGYTIIGEVAPYGAETEEEPEEDVESEENVEPEEGVEPEEDVEPAEDVESEEDEELIGESLKRKRSRKINEGTIVPPKYKDGDVVYLGDADAYQGTFLIKGNIENIPMELDKYIRRITKRSDVPDVYQVEYYMADNSHLSEKDYKEFYDFIFSTLRENNFEIIDVNGQVMESLKRKRSRSVNEAVIDYDTDNRSANIETESELITVEDNEDGGVSINTQPLDTLASEEEVIAPISDETVDEIEDANTEEPEFDDVDIEDPELDDALTAAAEDVGEEGEFDFDEFDEESFDGLGESYLKKCYENVNSFKTTAVKRSGSNLIIEGLIKFTSGNEKKTNFVFTEAANNEGRVKLEGYNEQISKGKKSFKLRGSVNNKSFVCESLNYNYRGKNALDESVRVYGTVRKAK